MGRLLHFRPPTHQQPGQHNATANPRLRFLHKRHHLRLDQDIEACPDRHLTLYTEMLLALYFATVEVYEPR